MMNLIDTNIILRYLVRDDESLYNKANILFKQAEQGKTKILVKVVVVAECCYVLESFYKKTKDEIASSMEVFLSQKWIKVEDRQSLLSMWEDYKKNLHFIDSYLLALARVNKYKITTFDKDLIKKFEANN